MNLMSMLADLYRRTDQPASPAAGVITRYTAHLNEALHEILSAPGLGMLVTGNHPLPTFASVANQPEYALPAGVSRIDAIVERTNNWRLDERTSDWYRREAPNTTAYSGTPQVWVPLGFQAVSQQPAAATGLWIVSSSASDTTQSVKVETVRTSGIPFSGAATLNGTTRVQVGTATDHEQVIKLYVSAVGVGTISLYDAAASGNVLGTIPIGLTYSRYQAIALWPTPASAITYYVDSEREQSELVNGTDEPPIPLRFHRVLVDGALAREYEKADDDRAKDARVRFVLGVRQLRYFVTCPPDFLPVSGGGRSPDRSRLGPYFPATRY